jgi:protein-disulfide isomerase-like protein with CxxC motif
MWQSQNIQRSQYICGLDPTTDQVLWQSQNIQRSQYICGLDPTTDQVLFGLW